ncbi:DEAD/DEAH box helicase family protein [Microbacterium sp. ZW T6_19]|uniref:DEAD/DEAH box helicase family protein n=1 Tax=Microbacterium sp. ZW T6_19 TaxID=3378082 RepID=UPI003851F612
MGNFDFVKLTQPQLFDDARRAETYVTTDPRTACFYARRVVENLVVHLGEVWNTPQPYRDDLAARISEPEFARRAGRTITLKLTLIRKEGNTAVHRTQAVAPQTAIGILRELFHVLVWAGFHHSPHPEAAPTGSQFDPELAAKAAPLSRTELVALAAKFKEQDENYARAVAQKNELLAAQEAEIARLRAEIEGAQRQNVATDDHDYSEAETRTHLIDALLRESGWALSEERDREHLVQGMPSPSGIGYVDYVLWGDNGLPLALVEAKRTTSSVELGQQQAALYADRLEARFGRRPIMFFTNGYEHRVWDDASGYPPRPIDGFYTKDELELAIQRRRERKPLSGAPVNTAVAGRPYQQRAIKAVGAAFDQRQRDALLVMATGAGKTRTTIALVQLLMDQGWVKRALFLADRTALVKQAAGQFTTHLPSVATVNLVTERAGEGRVFVATYPTMLNIINQVDDGERRFGPGAFDLIVIDEAHRSVYDKYGAIFDYFDGLLVGLTATPKEEVDRNTYRLFHLEDGVPTDAYTLEEAVDDGYLVPPRGVSVGTKFLRQGIRYDDLSDDEKDHWDLLDWGDEVPDEIGAEDINRFLFNEDTVDKVLATVMEQGYKVAGGDRLGKTIIFAKNQQHAEFISERFNIAYPELAGSFARVITHSVPYAQQLIDDFSNAEKAPHIAISVDMLDTGIDVPEVVNLVFFKAVRSKAKFWQMIGRGTRLRPDLFGPEGDKQDFLVFDFCGNLEFFNQNLPETPGSRQRSLTQRIFEARVGLLAGLKDAEPQLRESTAHALHAFVAGMNLDNILVRRHRAAVERFGTATSWASFQPTDAEQALPLGGLPSATIDTDEFAKRFDLLVLWRQVAQLDGDASVAERAREAIQGIARSLLGKLIIPMVKEQVERLEEVASDEWWTDVTLSMLELVRVRLRALARFADTAGRSPVYTDFEDTMGDAIEVTFTRSTGPTDFQRFREKVAAYLRAHADHLSLQKLRRNQQLTQTDLESLEGMLIDAGLANSIEIDYATGQTGGLGLFVRSLVGLDRSAVEEAFAAYLNRERFTVNQIRFVDMVVNELTETGVMEPDRLFQAPYTDQAPTGPTEVFTPEDSRAIVSILRGVRATALPPSETTVA